MVDAVDVIDFYWSFCSAIVLLMRRVVDDDFSLVPSTCSLNVTPYGWKVQMRIEHRP